MNTTKCYELVCDLWKSLDGDGANVILPHSLVTLKTMLEDDIKLEETKRTGGSGAVKRLREISKYLNNAGNQQKRLGKAWSQKDSLGDEFLCFTNSFTGFMLREKFDIPMGDDCIIDLTKVFPADAVNEVEVDITDVKSFIKIEKAKQAGLKPKDRKMLVYKLGNAWYNPQYIVDCYNILGGDIKFYETGKPLAPAVLESENGKAVLSPVRTSKQD